MWAEGGGQDRVPGTSAEGQVAAHTLWLHAGTRTPRDLSTNTTRVWPGTWPTPANIPVCYSKCVPMLPCAHPDGQQTPGSGLPAQHALSPGTSSPACMSTPPTDTHCSQFSLLSCRSARKRLDARASSSRSSSCLCSSRMAERMRRRSARSAVTSNCGTGGGGPGGQGASHFGCQGWRAGNQPPTAQPGAQ